MSEASSYSGVVDPSGMRARVAAFDWSATPLGPMDHWPETLRTAVDICLSSRFPMFVWWGPQLIQIYNDAYAPMLGKRHPDRLGEPASLVWADIWSIVGLQAAAVMERGESTWNVRVPLLMERNDYQEVAYFTWSYSPIRDSSGKIAGLFCAVSEETARVKAEAERDALAAQRKLALDAAKMGWWHFDPATGAATVDERFREIYGISEGAVTTEDLTAFVHPEDREAIAATFLGALETCNSHPVSATHRIVRRDGSVRWIDAHGVVTVEGDGANRRPKSFVGTVADVTDRKAAEHALRASEARLRSLVEQSAAGIAQTDLQGRIYFANQRFCNILGYTCDEIVGRRVHDFTHSDDLPETVKKVSAAQSDGEYSLEKRYIRKDGSTVWCAVSASVIKDADGKAESILGVVIDISDRKKAEAEVRLSEERFRLVNRATYDVIWDWDLRTDELQWNDMLETVYGHRLAAVPRVIGWWYEHVHADDRERVVEGVHAVIDGGATAWHGEYRFRRGDGTYAEVLDRGYIHRDAAGRPVRMIGSMLDRTERTRAEAALRESEARFRQLADAMPQIVWAAQPDGLVDYYNGKWYDYVAGTTGERSIGWEQVIHADDLEPTKSHWRTALRSGQTYSIEARLRRFDGEYRWHLARALPVKDADGKVIRWFGTDTDIHDQKLLQERNAQLLESERAARADAERASEAKSEFLATLSHELRTPLTPVLLTASLMESHPGLPVDLREDVATIRRNIELESRLISDLLDLTRITRGKLQLDQRDVDLHLVIRSAVDICQREASAKLKLDLSATNHIVRGDSTRLQQIFWNLINNAIKFTPEDGSIAVRSVDTADGRIRVTVSDTGAGIDPAVLPRLFNAFEQGEVRSARQQAGLGLGLAISKKLTEAHGGTIWAQSAGRGEGATFTVELPALEVVARQPTVPPRPPVQAPTARQSLKVLLVEDHEPTLRVMERLLRQIGHTVTGVTSVASAVSAARSDPFDVIISDLGLPDGSGLDVMRRLREQYSGRAIALTGYGMESDVAASREAGFTEHLTKPVDVASLEASLERVTKRAAAHDTARVVV